jgi:hypothetical protein
MPRSTGRSEKPNPGTDGTITSKLSAGSAPWRPGSVSSGISSSISVKELGHPWVTRSGIGAGPRPRSRMKWMPSPSTSARKWAKPLMACSWARQSNRSRQYAHSSSM